MKRICIFLFSGTFVISTAGEEHWLNTASSRLLIRILRQKGYGVFYDRQLAMPSNFIVKHDGPRVRQLLDSANARIPGIAQELLHSVPWQQKTRLAAKAMAFLGRAEWLGANLLGGFFYASKDCNRCGACAQSCLYLCPKHAVKIRPPFHRIPFAQWYENEELAVPGRK